MDANNQLIKLSTEQEIIFRDLLTKLFDQSIEGITETLNEVNSLTQRHTWYHSNLYQIRQLESKINEIQQRYDLKIKEISDEILLKKERTKQILFDVLNEHQSTHKIEEIRKYLLELFHGIDQLTEQMFKQALLKVIFAEINLFGIFAALAALFTGATAIGILSLGIGFLASSAASEVMFNQKLRELNEKLTNNISSIQRIKNEHWLSLSIYFQNFREKLQHYTSNNQSAIGNGV